MRKREFSSLKMMETVRAVATDEGLQISDYFMFLAYENMVRTESSDSAKFPDLVFSSKHNVSLDDELREWVSLDGRTLVFRFKGAPYGDRLSINMARRALGLQSIREAEGRKSIFSRIFR